MARFEDFYTLIMPWAPGVSEPAMDNALLQAAIAFCQETQVWTDLSDPMTVLPGVSEYEIDLPIGAEVARVLEVAISGSRIDPVPFDSLSDMVSNWRSAVGQPGMYVQSQPGVIRLVPAPAERLDRALTYRVAFQPSQRATNLPDILRTRYAKALSHGALAALQSQVDRTYSNPQDAAVNFTLFEQAKADAAIDQFRGFGRAPIRSRAAFF